MTKPKTLDQLRAEKERAETGANAHSGTAGRWKAYAKCRAGKDGQ